MSTMYLNLVLCNLLNSLLVVIMIATNLFYFNISLQTDL